MMNLMSRKNQDSSRSLVLFVRLHLSPDTPHRTSATRRKLEMLRLSLYVVGVSAFLAAWALYRNQQRTRPVPAKKAAEMLQEAWADYHTRA